MKNGNTSEWEEFTEGGKIKDNLVFWTGSNFQKNNNCFLFKSSFMLDWGQSVYSFCNWFAHKKIWFQDIPSACQFHRAFWYGEAEAGYLGKRIALKCFHVKESCNTETVLGNDFPWQQKTYIVNFLGLSRFSNVCEIVFY